MRHIGLVNGGNTEEYNARFVVGDKAAEQLEYGKSYTLKELHDISGKALNFINTSNRKLANSYRCVDIDGGI